MTTLTHPLKWPGSHRRLAPRITAEALDALDGKPPTAIIDCTVGGAGFLLEALAVWPEARVLMADTCEPLARLWLDLSTAAGAAEVEASVAAEAAKWAAADALAEAASADPVTRTIDGKAITATGKAWARFDARREWHGDLRARWNADNLRHLAEGPLVNLSPETGRGHSARFAALLRGSYKGLCRFSQRGAYNVGCAAELANRAGRPLYEAGAFAAVGVELERRLARIACASYRAMLPAIARLLPGALVYIDPPFPGGFVAFSPGCSAPPIAELAESCAFASSRGAVVIASHPAEGADEWRAHLPGAKIHVDLVCRGAMEPDPDAEAPRKDRAELLAVLRPGVGSGAKSAALAAERARAAERRRAAAG